MLKVNKHCNNMIKQAAFTLAEVLITLGIIGIVAQMTLPTLYQNTEKQVAVTKLQKFYSTMEQAMRLSEIDNGPPNSWEYGTVKDPAATETWFKTYLGPYMRYNNIDKTTLSDAIIIRFDDGAEATFFSSGFMDIRLFTNGYQKSKTYGKDIFYMEIDKKSDIKAFRAYDYNTTGSEREKWTTGPYACNKSAQYMLYCTGLIIYDGWTIKKDYPFWN